MQVIEDHARNIPPRTSYERTSARIVEMTADPFPLPDVSGYIDLLDRFIGPDHRSRI